jgi:hypothetical protein
MKYDTDKQVKENFKNHVWKKYVWPRVMMLKIPTGTIITTTDNNQITVNKDKIYIGTFLTLRSLYPIEGIVVDSIKDLNPKISYEENLSSLLSEINSSVMDWKTNDILKSSTICTTKEKVYAMIESLVGKENAINITDKLKEHSNTNILHQLL